MAVVLKEHEESGATKPYVLRCRYIAACGVVPTFEWKGKIVEFNKKGKEDIGTHRPVMEDFASREWRSCN